MIAEWKTIDSAPLDGTKIHVWGPDYGWPEVVSWFTFDETDAKETGTPGYWAYAEPILADHFDSPEDLTHWMPLPAPPEAE